MNIINKPYLIQLPKITDPRGNLSFFENSNQIPFDIKRTFWIYDVPGGEERGAHAYRHTEEFIVAMSGSFDVILDDGKGYRETFHLNRSYYGLYVPPMYWCEVVNFSTNSVCLVCASSKYDSEEYIYDYTKFQMETIKKQVSVPEEINNGGNNFDGRKSRVYDCSIIEFDKHHSERKGNLSVIENDKDVPFDIKRVYYLYDVPGGESRGAHAHKALSQLIVAVSGSFTVTLNDGNVKRSFLLNRPYQGLLVKPGIWRDLDDFSSGSVLLCLASELYDTNDYIRDYESFVEFKRK